MPDNPNDPRLTNWELQKLGYQWQEATENMEQFTEKVDEQEAWNDDMFDLIAYAQDNLTRAYAAVGDWDGKLNLLEGLVGAQRRIQQAIDHYYEKEG